LADELRVDELVKLTTRPGVAGDTSQLSQ
jgi:hypothetical protein